MFGNEKAGINPSFQDHTISSPSKSKPISHWVFIGGADPTVLHPHLLLCGAAPSSHQCQAGAQAAPSARILNKKQLQCAGAGGRDPLPSAPGVRRGERVQHNQREIHFQGRRLVVIAPEINKSTNGSIFNKLHTEGECNLQRLIEQVSVLFREVTGEAALTKEPVRGQFGQWRELSS